MQKLSSFVFSTYDKKTTMNLSSTTVHIITIPKSDTKVYSNIFYT